MMGIRITYLIKTVKFTIIVKEREKVYLTLKILLYNTIYQKYIRSWVNIFFIHEYYFCKRDRKKSQLKNPTDKMLHNIPDYFPQFFMKF